MARIPTIRLPNRGHEGRGTAAAAAERASRADPVSAYAAYKAAASHRRLFGGLTVRSLHGEGGHRVRRRRPTSSEHLPDRSAKTHAAAALRLAPRRVDSLDTTLAAASHASCRALFAMEQVRTGEGGTPRGRLSRICGRLHLPHFHLGHHHRGPTHDDHLIATTGGGAAAGAYGDATAAEEAHGELHGASHGATHAAGAAAEATPRRARANTHSGVHFHLCPRKASGRPRRSVEIRPARFECRAPSARPGRPGAQAAPQSAA